MRTTIDIIPDKKRQQRWQAADVALQSHVERARRRIVTLIFVVYWLLIFEGVLRKWVLPEFHRELFFIKDPFVLVIYLSAFNNGFWPRRSPFLRVGLLFAVIAIPLALIQMLWPGSDFDLLLGSTGWRNYFLYLPLAFIIGEVFEEADLDRLTRHTLAIAIPMAALMYAQSLAPGSAVINQGFGDIRTNIFPNLGVEFGVVRPYGTFTSAWASKLFVASVFALLAAAWIRSPRRRPVSRPLLYAATLAAAAALAISGSRGAFLHVGLVAITTVIVGIVVRQRWMSLRAWTMLIASVLIVTFVAPIIFPAAIEAFSVRWENAYFIESQVYQYGIFGRALGGFTDFIGLLADAPLVGYGFGFGSNAAKLLILHVSETTAFPYAESDWERQVVDFGPLLGVLFIVFRVIFTFVLAKQALAATARTKEPLPLMLFGFVGIVLLYDNITGHGQVMAYGWLFVGFLMAASKIYSSESIILRTRDYQ